MGAIISAFDLFFRTIGVTVTLSVLLIVTDGVAELNQTFVGIVGFGSLIIVIFLTIRDVIRRSYVPGDDEPFVEDDTTTPLPNPINPDQSEKAS